MFSWLMGEKSDRGSPGYVRITVLWHVCACRERKPKGSETEADREEVSSVRFSPV